MAEKMSWPSNSTSSSPSSPQPLHHSSDTGSTTPRVRELEATQAPRLQFREKGNSPPLRHELVGSPTAKELPPLPLEVRKEEGKEKQKEKQKHVSELAGDGLSGWKR